MRNVIQNLKIGTRYILLTGILLILFWSGSVYIGIYAQNYNMRIIVQEQAVRLGDSIMNSLNYLMLNNQMDRADFFITQGNKLDGVSDLRVFRAPVVNAHFNREAGYRGPTDDLERRVIAGGKSYTGRMDDNAKAHRIRVIVPYIASSNRKGINCLGCHQVKEDTVLGGISMVVNLDREESFTNQLTIIFIIMMIFGLFVITGIIHLITVITLNRPLGKIASLLLDVSQGDLSEKEAVRSRGELSELNRSLLETVSSFRVAVQGILDMTEKLQIAGLDLKNQANTIFEQSTGQLSMVKDSAPVLDRLRQISEKIQTDSNLQVDEAKEATGLIDEISGSLNQINEQVQNIREMQEHIHERTMGGQVALEKTQTGMHKIEDSTKAITEVLSALNEISDRTQLLALNASIEAARAGEVGQGFAVVAGEVSKLSQNSAEYSARIKQLVLENQGNVKIGSDFMKDVNLSFHEIFTSVRTNADMIRKIAEEFSRQNQNSTKASLRMRELSSLSHSIVDSTLHQLNSSHEVELAMESIQESSRKFVTLSDDLNQRAENLADLSEDLKNTLKRFRLE